jgi:hypothetical protein
MLDETVTLTLNGWLDSQDFKWSPQNIPDGKTPH